MYPNPKLLTKRAIHEVAPLGLSQVTLVGEQEVHSIFPTLGARWSVVIRAEHAHLVAGSGCQQYL